MATLDKDYYQGQLIEYLRNTKYYSNADDQKIQKLLNAIENDLLDVICSNLHVDILQVYEFLDKEALRELIHMTNRGRSLASQNEQSDGLLREAMDYYLGYLGSNKHPLSEKEIKRRKKKTNKNQDSSIQVPTSPAGTVAMKPISVASEPESYDKLEGKKHEDTVTRYERDRGNRKKCIEHYGYVCQVCGTNFEKKYGELGKAFIEVHHLHPVAQGERQVNPIEDLIPLCSNCHSMIHRMDDVSDWQKLRSIYLENKKTESNNAEEHN